MIGLFGGTFDPIHNGHVELARQVLQAFSLHHIEFLPCYLPVHRTTPGASSAQRAQMVRLAIEGQPGFRLNSMELERGGPSYTIDSLRTIRQRQPKQTLCWLMGADSFNEFDRWMAPSGILQLAHLIVCERPGIRVRNGLLSDHRLAPGESLQQYEAGKVAVFPIIPNPCSATAVRQHLMQGHSPDNCLASPVLDFIYQNKLYQESISNL